MLVDKNTTTPAPGTSSGRHGRGVKNSSGRSGRISVGITPSGQKMSPPRLQTIATPKVKPLFTNRMFRDSDLKLNCNQLRQAGSDGGQYEAMRALDLNYQSRNHGQETEEHRRENLLLTAEAAINQSLMMETQTV